MFLFVHPVFLQSLSFALKEKFSHFLGGLSLSFFDVTFVRNRFVELQLRDFSSAMSMLSGKPDVQFTELF